MDNSRSSIFTSGYRECETSQSADASRRMSAAGVQTVNQLRHRRFPLGFAAIPLAHSVNSRFALLPHATVCPGAHCASFTPDDVHLDKLSKTARRLAIRQAVTPNRSSMKRLARGKIRSDQPAKNLHAVSSLPTYCWEVCTCCASSFGIR